MTRNRLLLDEHGCCTLESMNPRTVTSAHCHRHRHRVCVLPKLASGSCVVDACFRTLIGSLVLFQMMKWMLDQPTAKVATTVLWGRQTSLLTCMSGGKWLMMTVITNQLALTYEPTATSGHPSGAAASALPSGLLEVAWCIVLCASGLLEAAWCIVLYVW